MQEVRGAAESQQRIDHLRIKHLKLLRLIRSEGSLSAVADKIALGQPAVTSMVQDLEAAFGLTLIDRTRRGAALNASGLLLFERLEQALEGIAAAVQTAHSLPRLPTLRLGIMPIMGIDLLPRVLSAMRAQGTMPQFHLREDRVANLLTDLSRGHYDAVLSMFDSQFVEAEVMSELKFEPITTHSLQVACSASHPWRKRKRISLEDLQDAQWVLPPHNTLPRKAFDRVFLANGLSPPSAIIASSPFHTNMALIAGSELLSIASEKVIAYYRTMNRITSLPQVRHFGVGKSYIVTRLDTAPIAVLTDFLTLLRAAIAGEVQSE